MHRPADVASGTLCIERCCDPLCVGIELIHGVQLWSGFDPLFEVDDRFHGSEPSRRHGIPQLCDAKCVDWPRHAAASIPGPAAAPPTVCRGALVIRGTVCSRHPGSCQSCAAKQSGGATGLSEDPHTTRPPNHGASSMPAHGSLAHQLLAHEAPRHELALGPAAGDRARDSKEGSDLVAQDPPRPTVRGRVGLGRARVHSRTLERRHPRNAPGVRTRTILGSSRALAIELAPRASSRDRSPGRVCPGPCPNRELYTVRVCVELPPVPRWRALQEWHHAAARGA